MLCALPTSLWSPLSSLHFHPVESSCNPLFPLKSSFLLSCITCLSTWGAALLGEIPWVAPPGGILWYALETVSVATVSDFISFHLLSVLVCMPPSLMACCLLPSALGDPNCISLVFMFPLNVLLLRNDNYTFVIHHWHPSAIVTPAICGCWAPTVLWLNRCRVLRTTGFPKPVPRHSALKSFLNLLWQCMPSI